LKVFLDEGVHEIVSEYLPSHAVENVRELGLKGVKKEDYWPMSRRRGFEAFVTNDKRLEAEGQLRRRPFGTLILSVTNWELISPMSRKSPRRWSVPGPGRLRRSAAAASSRAALASPESPALI